MTLDFIGAAGGGYCDSLRRRDFLRVGGLLTGGLALPELMRLRAAAGETATPKKAAILNPVRGISQPTEAGGRSGCVSMPPTASPAPGETDPRPVPTA